MKKTFLIFSYCLLLCGLLALSSCKEGIDDLTTNGSEKPPFNSGTKLTYSIIETQIGNSNTKGVQNVVSEKANVEIFFDESKSNYQIRTRRIKNSNDDNLQQQLSEVQWAEKIENNVAVTMFNELGQAMLTRENSEKGDYDPSTMFLPYTERAIKVKEMIDNLKNSKDGEIIVEDQGDQPFVKLLQKEINVNAESGKTEELTLVSYVNTRYGVPVLSETYNERGERINKMILLYKLIDDVPIVAHEESITYGLDYNGETIEYKAIAHYDNINLINY